MHLLAHIEFEDSSGKDGTLFFGGQRMNNVNGVIENAIRLCIVPDCNSINSVLKAASYNEESYLDDYHPYIRKYNYEFECVAHYLLSGNSSVKCDSAALNIIINWSKGLHRLNEAIDKEVNRYLGIPSALDIDYGYSSTGPMIEIYNRNVPDRMKL